MKSSLSSFPNLDLSLNLLSPQPHSKKSTVITRATKYDNAYDTHENDVNMIERNVETSAVESPSIVERNKFNHYGDTATFSRVEEQDIILNNKMSNTNNNTYGATSLDGNAANTMDIDSSSTFIRGMNTLSNHTAIAGDGVYGDISFGDEGAFNSPQDEDEHLKSGNPPSSLSAMRPSTEDREITAEMNHKELDQNDVEITPRNIFIHDEKKIIEEETDNLDDDNVEIEMEKDDTDDIEDAKEISEFDCIMDEAAQMIGEAETYLDEMRMIQVKNAILMDSLVIIGA